MKKTLILALAFWTGLSNFAYASAKIECADMMRGNMAMKSASAASSHECCPSVPCQCSVQKGENHQSVPSQAVFYFGDRSVFSEAVPAAVLASSAPSRAVVRAESPPSGPPLYQLFSAYRI